MANLERFNLVASNLFLAMLEGDVSAGRLARGSKRLGLQLLSLEPSYLTSHGRSNPDAVAYSTSRRFTCIAEWTRNSTPKRKQEQLRIYLRTSTKDLRENAAVPARATAAAFTLLVVPLDFAAGYVRLVQAGGLCIVVAISLDGERIGLSLELDTTGRSLARRLLPAGYCIKRFPLGYIPFDIDDLSIRNLADPVIQQLVSYAIQGKAAFTLHELCEDILPAFTGFTRSAQTSIAEGVRRVMKAATRSNYAGKWIKRADGESPAWIFALPTGSSVSQMSKRVRKAMEALRREITSEVREEHQLLLFE